MSLVLARAFYRLLPTSSCSLVIDEPVCQPFENEISVIHCIPATSASTV